MILSLELVFNIACYSSTNRSIDKEACSVCCDEIDKSEDLWLMFELVECFDSNGNLMYLSLLSSGIFTM